VELHIYRVQFLLLMTVNNDDDRRSQAAGDFAKSAASSTSLQMMALHEELVQRMKTVADADSQATEDDDVLSIVVFEPSTTSEPDLGRVEVQRVDADRLPQARQPNADKKPTVATPSRGGERAAPVSRQNSSQGQTPARRPAQLVMCVNKYGENQGDLKDPLGVACLPGGKIVVSEWGNRRLQVFDTSGKSLRLIAPGQVYGTCFSSCVSYQRYRKYVFMFATFLRSYFLTFLLGL